MVVPQKRCQLEEGVLYDVTHNLNKRQRCGGEGQRVGMLPRQCECQQCSECFLRASGQCAPNLAAVEAPRAPLSSPYQWPTSAQWQVVQPVLHAGPGLAYVYSGSEWQLQHVVPPPTH